MSAHDEEQPSFDERAQSAIDEVTEARELYARGDFERAWLCLREAAAHVVAASVNANEEWGARVERWFA